MVFRYRDNVHYIDQWMHRPINNNVGVRTLTNGESPGHIKV